MVRRDICVIIVESEERKSEDYGSTERQDNDRAKIFSKLASDSNLP